MIEPPPHVAEDIAKGERGDPDLHGSGPRHFQWRAWRAPPLYYRRPRQHLASVVLICEGLTIDDTNFSRTGERNDAALLEPGQGAAHGFDRKRQIIGDVIACYRQREPIRQAIPYALLYVQQKRSDLLLRGGAAEYQEQGVQPRHCVSREGVCAAHPETEEIAG